MYTTAALETDLTKAGGQLASNIIIASTLQGRAHAVLGNTAAAAAALEHAVAVAQRSGWCLLEIFALRDLQLCVLEPTGHADHGSCRLGASLRQCCGVSVAASALPSSVLKGIGMNADELLGLPPPDEGYEILFPQSQQEEEAAAAAAGADGGGSSAQQAQASSSSSSSSSSSLRVEY